MVRPGGPLPASLPTSVPAVLSAAQATVHFPKTFVLIVSLNCQPDQGRPELHADGSPWFLSRLWHVVSPSFCVASGSSQVIGKNWVVVPMDLQV